MLTWCSVIPLACGRSYDKLKRVSFDWSWGGFCKRNSFCLAYFFTERQAHLVWLIQIGERSIHIEWKGNAIEKFSKFNRSTNAIERSVSFWHRQLKYLRLRRGGRRKEEASSQVSSAIQCHQHQHYRQSLSLSSNNVTSWKLEISIEQHFL